MGSKVSIETFFFYLLSLQKFWNWSNWTRNNACTWLMRVLTCLNLDISVKARKCFLLTYFWASLYFCSDFRSSTRRNKERKKTFVHGIGFGWYQIYFCHAGSPSENPSACTCLVYSSISKPLLTLPVRLLTYNSSTNIMPFAGLYLMYTTVMLSALFYNYRPEFGFIKIDMMLCLCESSIIMDHACCWQWGLVRKFIPTGYAEVLKHFGRY